MLRADKSGQMRHVVESCSYVSKRTGRHRFLVYIGVVGQALNVNNVAK